MALDQWLDLIAKAGWPVVALIGLAYFLARHVWPFVLKQIEVAQATRQAEMKEFFEAMKEFLEALRRRDAHAEQTQAEVIEVLHKMAGEISVIRSEQLRSRV
jgi:ABC-type nitrate/sulfonate/bicarbonate transport system substrate-binding protein